MAPAICLLSAYQVEHKTAGPRWSLYPTHIPAPKLKATGKTWGVGGGQKGEAEGLWTRKPREQGSVSGRVPHLGAGQGGIRADGPEMGILVED